MGPVSLPLRALALLAACLLALCPSAHAKSPWRLCWRRIARNGEAAEATPAPRSEALPLAPHSPPPPHPPVQRSFLPQDDAEGSQGLSHRRHSAPPEQASAMLAPARTRLLLPNTSRALRRGMASTAEPPLPDAPDAAALMQLAAGWSQTPPGWGSGHPCDHGSPTGSSWYGVTCGPQRVIVLQIDFGMSWNGLSLPRLQGTISPAISQLEALLILSLRNHRLSGPIPAALGKLPSLAFLYLQGNQLNGSIPSALGALQNLKDLALKGNQLSGSIPDALGQLQNLAYVALDYNLLSGSIPSSLARLQSLTWLRLTKNQLSGAIPAALGQIRSLQYLYLDSNQLSGTIPTALAQLQSLRFLVLSSNFLSGTIPTALVQLQSLAVLNLTDNELSGSIPTALALLQSLGDLLLSGNQLSGTIPAALGELPNLYSLGLADNRLYGTIPAALVKLNSVHVFYLRLNGNFLSGAVPVGILSFYFLTLQSNFFSSSPCEQGRLFPRVNHSNNCLPQNNTCKEPRQRTPDSCTLFCNASAPEGPCAGQGVCTLQGPNSLPTCICNPRYYAPWDNPGTCVLSNGTSPPPRPPPAGSSNRTQGVVYGISAPMVSLNRWSRYLSIGYSLSRGVAAWNYTSVSAWMAPSRELFVSTISLGPATSGILSWGAPWDQGQCAATWAFIAADAVSAAVCIANYTRGGPVPALSGNQIQQCSNTSAGCSGDFPTNALDYAARAFLEPGTVAPSCTSPVLASKPPQTVMYEAVAFRSWLGLLLTLQAQPAIVVLDGSSSAFQQPLCTKGFVLSDPSCDTGSLSHAVLVVGYDLSIDWRRYWVIRNSWGPSWCAGGYMRLAIQGGTGVCGMNQLPVYYPVPAPQAGDPCYTNSTAPDGPTRPALNPCGGGACLPQPGWGPYGYSCNCSALPTGFVAVNNTVPARLGAVQSTTQTCAPVDACGLGLSNPCQVGTCVNDGQGGYSCICPPGHALTEYVEGTGPTCTYVAFPITTNASYVAGYGVTCRMVAATYQLPLAKLSAQNPTLSCGLPQLRVPLGKKVNVSNPSFSCAVAYTIPGPSVTCRKVAEMLTTRKNLSPQSVDYGYAPPDLQQLNPGTDCDLLVPGQLLCLRPGLWVPPASCARFHVMSKDDTCKSVSTQYLYTDPVPLYAYNRGIYCDPSGPKLEAQGTQVCVGVDAQRSTSTCSRGYSPYTLGPMETCARLLGNKKLGFRNRRDIEQINQPYGFTCARAFQGQQICYRNS